MEERKRSNPPHNKGKGIIKRYIFTERGREKGFCYDLHLWGAMPGIARWEFQEDPPVRLQKKKKALMVRKGKRVLQRENKSQREEAMCRISGRSPVRRPPGPGGEKETIIAEKRITSMKKRERRATLPPFHKEAI